MLHNERATFISKYLKRLKDFECGSCYFKGSDGETLKMHRSSVHKLPRQCCDCDFKALGAHELIVFQDFVSYVAHIMGSAHGN